MPRNLETERAIKAEAVGITATGLSNDIVVGSQNPETAHRVLTQTGKNPGQVPGSKPDPMKSRHTPVADRVRNKGDRLLKPKPSAKPKTATGPQKFHNVKGMMNRFNKSPWLKYAQTLGIALLLAKFADVVNKKLHSGPLRTSTASIIWDPRANSYIPDNYKRGFDVIKENTTDFGSRVNLSKTVMKTNVTPMNSTRHNLFRSVQSTINGNDALRLHSRAIGHTRY